MKGEIELNNEHKRKKQRIKKALIVVFILPLILICTFLIYAANYYHADSKANDSMISDDIVKISKSEYGWMFDGPSDNDLLIFYPGAKVEATSYSPILHELASREMDVYLVKMPFNFAFFGINKADDVIEQSKYENYYIGGHSLGGAMAANYAAENNNKVKGVVLFAAYPAKQLPDNLIEISIYGTEDKVLNNEKYIEGKNFSSNNLKELIIEGGNHAQFGNYGLQKGDGAALITSDEQQISSIYFIIDSIKSK